ncbi:hypothetical protein [Microbacterium sp. K24]|uniref:hypothetical protein n=1 Tax=Microbacterium sp. K24 TaxID=2305446 RepID=UPI00109CC146|nr:hypothetical protein [Microbacterium sp. K24]
MSTIKELQQQIGEINAANGWRTTNEADLDAKARVNAQITRLALITTEVAEAIEEIRNGRDADERYYTGGVGDHSGSFSEREPLDANGAPRKPEGVPSELADIVIRALDAAGAWGIDLESVIEEKLAYNLTRGHRHGGKAV